METACAAATLAGEFISAEGIVFGGSRDASAESLLERKARISMLSAEHSEICSERDALLQKRGKASAGLEKAKNDFEQARTQYEIADREQSTSENQDCRPRTRIAGQRPKDRPPPLGAGDTRATDPSCG